MSNDQELFDLCKQVYEATGWDTGRYFEPLKPGGRSSNYPPKYTSDYLLEKLPGFVSVYKESSGREYKAQLNYGEVSEARYWSDTPLKALLKLTLKLINQGIDLKENK